MKRTGWLWCWVWLFMACDSPEQGTVIQTWETGAPKEVHREMQDGSGVEVTIFHGNGKIHMRGKLLGGQRQGTWNTYREDGLPWSQVEYAGGIKDGLFRTWHTDGRPHIEGQHKSGSPTGSWRFFDVNGNLDHTEDFGGAN